jgi:tetratricopeptide (TPR) repeat protein
MRKILVIALLLSVSLLAFAQQPSTYTAETSHYRVTAETSQAQADEVSRKMEAALSLYNDIFHFDLAQLPAKLRVRLFRDIDSFNDYLSKVLSQKRTDFVFVAWSDPEKSELLCFPKEEKAFTASLLHQGSIQFIKAFIENPPVWMREGIAAYLDAASWDARTGAFSARPNLAWLDGLKAIMRGETPAKLIAFADLLTSSREKAQSQMDVFAPQSWGLVQFLLNADDRSYGRMLWDSIGALDPRASLEDNSQRARTRAFSWVSGPKLQRDFESYIMSLKTASDWLKDGIDRYGAGDSDKAEQAFTKSLELDPGSRTAWYYLGLLSYGRKEYAKAEDQYLKAFQLGANAGIINYALGVNAFAAGKLTDASKYLNFAKDADKAAYGEKADALLKRIAGGK